MTRRSCRDLLTDGDGNPATGPEPTVVVVGDAQQLPITKQVVVVGGGPALAGATLEYLVQAYATSAPCRRTTSWSRDDLDATPGPSHVRRRLGDAERRANGVVVAGAVITAQLLDRLRPARAGRIGTLRFRASSYPDLPIGTHVTNTGTVYWNDPTQTGERQRLDRRGRHPRRRLAQWARLARRRLRPRLRRRTRSSSPAGTSSCCATTRWRTSRAPRPTASTA